MKKNKRAQISKDEKAGFIQKEIQEYDEEQLAEIIGGAQPLSQPERAVTELEDDPELKSGRRRELGG